MVRVNAQDTGLTSADLEAVLTPGVDAIMLPKVQTPDDVHRIHTMLMEREVAAGLGPGSMALIAMIESALGVENAFRIATAPTEPPRIHTLAFGAADFTLDMGVRMSKSGEELFYPRARIALACRAAGLDGPLDTPFMIDLKDMEAFAADTLRGKNLGFGGKICVHPSQIDITNRIYSPSLEDIEFAGKVVTSFEEAEARGIGVIQVDGKMIDPPIVAQSRRILAVAAAMKR
jgi:citrate lyase subunit beta/citryl-CoA lyase